MDRSPLAARCLLFVPGDRPDRMTKALDLGADALILDLEDAVALANKPAARAAVAQFLALPRGHGIALIVRVNAVDSDQISSDLSAILPSPPDAIMLPKAEGQGSVKALSDMARSDWAGGQLPPLLPLTAETPASLFDLASFRQCSDQLCGLTWGGEDLAAAIGAKSNRNESGALTSPFVVARALILFAGHAAGIPAFETVYADIADSEGLSRRAMLAANDGFCGMMAIHPSQIPIINAAFTPSDEEIAMAHAILDGFSADPSAGVLKIKGKMIDAAHIKHARGVLARSKP